MRNEWKYIDEAGQPTMDAVYEVKYSFETGTGKGSELQFRNGVWYDLNGFRSVFGNRRSHTKGQRYKFVRPLTTETEVY